MCCDRYQSGSPHVFWEKEQYIGFWEHRHNLSHDTNFWHRARGSTYSVIQSISGSCCGRPMYSTCVYSQSSSFSLLLFVPLPSSALWYFHSMHMPFLGLGFTCFYSLLISCIGDVWVITEEGFWNLFLIWGSDPACFPHFATKHVAGNEHQTMHLCYTIHLHRHCSSW